ncbi:ABC transporter ATP-binding protein [Patulibacter minatonensis]|uniref:ABC transporter ATP-binding protein n=1 Tax=Patulibacter minatonensis TaxID=298163 RepID=UPI0004B7EDB9|nr:ABC transporter ATP-binding protein [Patulibacter minatonensis]
MGTFRRLLGFLRPYRRLWAVSFVLALLAMGVTVLSPALIGHAIDRIRDGDKGGLTEFAVALALLGIGRMVLTIGRRLVAGRVSLGVEQDLRDRLYGHLQALDLGFFDRWQTGQLMSRATVDLSAVRFFLGYGLVFVVQSLLTVVLAAIAMTIQQPLLALACLVPAPLIVFVGHAYGVRGRPAQQDAQQAVAEVTASAEESISGIRVVKAFAAEDRRQEAFGEAVEHAFQKQLRAVRIDASFQPVVQFLPQISLAIVLLVGGRMVVDDTISLGQFTAFFVYVMMLVQPLRSLGVMLGLGQRATASGARLFQVLDRAPDIVAPEGAALRTLPLATEGAAIGAVEFDDVTLRYPDQDTPALSDVSVSVLAGERVAIVGQTGSGKTALVQLLPRLYDPERGRVLIDGVDVRDLDPTALRHEIAIIDDDPFLFTATVAENIAYAAPGATRAEIEGAARRARAHEFVTELPDGYDTVVGERGLTLSGGQRQRLAIARALLAGPAPGTAERPGDAGQGPRILVLDDATSNVDASTEQEITAGLREVMRGRTTLVIAHRLSTVLLADRVVVLHQGRVADVGTHQDLVERSELYREIVTYGMADQVFLSREDRPTEVQEA